MTDAAALYGHRGTSAIQRMVEFAPSTGGLALWVGHRDVPAGHDAPAIMTDGHAVFYGQTFAALPLAERTGLVAHEVLHIALRHPQRYLDLQRVLGDVDLHLFNICADAIVNSTLSHLTWLRLPATAVFLDQLLAHALSVKQDVESALLVWDVERLYRAIDDRRIRPQGSRDRSERSGSSAGPSESCVDGPRAASARALAAKTEIDLMPTDASQDAPEAEAEQTRDWSERILRGHANDGAFSMLRALIADLPRSRTPWQQILRTRLARGLSRKATLSWSRPTRSYIANQGRGGPNRRLPFEPGFAANKTAPRLAVIIDVSGSIDDGLMARFASEIAAISRRQEADLVLIVGDDRVQRVDRFEPGRFKLDGIPFDGGGGTDFSPLLAEADRHQPDIAVVLTDLEGPTRYRPHCPVIWAVPDSHADALPPFGRLLVLS